MVNNMKKFLRIIIAIMILPLWFVLMTSMAFLTTVAYFGFWIYEKPVCNEWTWKTFRNQFLLITRLIR
jgi:hypothetical protein